MILKKETFYKEHKILLCYNKRTNIYYAKSFVGNTGDYESSDEALQAIQKDIDNFLNLKVDSVSDLAMAITRTLQWTIYEDCYVDKKRLEVLLQKHLETK